MSVKVMGRIWELDLPHNHLLVLLALADHADHDGGGIYPGIGLIAWKTGYSERQVQRVMRDLEKAGLLIEVERRIGMASVYRLDFTHAPAKSPYTKPINPPPAPAPRGRQNVTPPPRQNVTPPGDILSPVTSEGGVTNRHQGGDIAVSPRGDISNISSTDPPRPDAAQPPPTVMEPSWNRHGEGSASLDASPAPAPPTKKARRAPDPNQQHRACQVFADLAGKKPNAVQAAAIVAAVPDTDAGAAAWERVVRDWLGKGWASGNVNGMLDRYRKEATRAQPRPDRPNVPGAPARRIRSVFDPPGPPAGGEPPAVPDVRRADRAARDGGRVEPPPPEVLDRLPVPPLGHRRE